MTKVSDINALLSEYFPLDTAMSYDNVGLIIGDKSQQVKKIYLALDLTKTVIDKAVNNRYDMVITHHPLIFGGINNILEDTPSGYIIRKVVKNDINYLAFHTNLDYSDEFSNSILAKRIFGEQVDLISPSKEKVFCGVIADGLSDSLDNIMNMVKKNLDSSGVISINKTDSKVSKAFIQGGSFDEDVISYLVENKVDLVISGEIKHHICILLESLGISTIIAGHNATERVYLPRLKQLINDNFDDVDIFVDFGNETFV